MVEPVSQYRGCLLGLACGDAVGTTVEFCERGSFAPVTDMVGGGPFRLPHFAAGTSAWWLEQQEFFGGLKRERIWVFWRRVLHTCHHRTQVQTWLRLAGHEPVPEIYGTYTDARWYEADPA